jgi:hypothetical protein
MTAFVIRFLCSLTEFGALIVWVTYQHAQPEAVPVVTPILFLIYILADCAGDIATGYVHRKDVREWKELCDRAIAAATEAQTLVQNSVERRLRLPAGSVERMVGRN